jgi:hypothetical protein
MLGKYYYADDIALMLMSHTNVAWNDVAQSRVVNVNVVGGRWRVRSPSARRGGWSSSTTLLAMRLGSEPTLV